MQIFIRLNLESRCKLIKDINSPAAKIFGLILLKSELSIGLSRDRIFCNSLIRRENPKFRRSRANRKRAGQMIEIILHLKMQLFIRFYLEIKININ